MEAKKVFAAIFSVWKERAGLTMVSLIAVMANKLILVLITVTPGAVILQISVQRRFLSALQEEAGNG